MDLHHQGIARPRLVTHRIGEQTFDLHAVITRPGHVLGRLQPPLKFRAKRRHGTGRAPRIPEPNLFRRRGITPDRRQPRPVPGK